MRKGRGDTWISASSEARIGALPDPESAGPELSRQVAAFRGEGEAAEGQVRATASGAGEITALVVEPRVLRRGSEEIADLVRQAVNAALADARRQGDAQLTRSMEPLREAAARVSDDMNGVVQRILADVARARRRVS